MFSNWQGLNILSYGNWIVSPLMEMCQTCPCTQQTADSEWRSIGVLKVKCGKMERKKWKREEMKFCLLIYHWKKDAVMKQNSWVMLFCCHSASICSSNIYLRIYILTVGFRPPWILLVLASSQPSRAFSQVWQHTQGELT